MSFAMMFLLGPVVVSVILAYLLAFPAAVLGLFWLLFCWRR